MARRKGDPGKRGSRIGRVVTHNLVPRTTVEDLKPAGLQDIAHWVNRGRWVEFAPKQAEEEESSYYYLHNINMGRAIGNAIDAAARADAVEEDDTDELTAQEKADGAESGSSGGSVE